MSPSSASNDEGAPDDRRNHERITTRIEVRFKGPNEAARAFRAYSLNFSVGGLCFRATRPYEIGQVLQVAMTVETHHFELEATVAWSHKGAIGVRFENVSEADQQRLRAVMQALRK